MRIVLFVFILVVGSAAAADKAEIIEVPASFKTTVAQAPLKCEGGSCWVYHGTTERVNFAPAAVCQSCRAAPVSIETYPARVYCSKPALECRSREVVCNDCDWRSSR